jgi:hypothetical protein
MNTSLEEHKTNIVLFLFYGQGPKGPGIVKRPE